jgi:tetratricopeptide (TPR) repeat protein
LVGAPRQWRGGRRFESSIAHQRKIMNINILQKQADNLRNSGKTEEAILTYKKLFELYNQNNNFNNAGHSLQMIGVCYKIDNNAKKAIIYLKKAKRYYEKHKIKDGMGNALRDIGITYEYINKLILAEKYLKRSGKILKYSKDKGALGITQAKLGLVQIKQKRLNEAEKNIKNAIQILKKSNHWFEYATAMMHLAELYLESKNFRKAIQFIDKAIKLLDYNKQQNIHIRRYAQLWGMKSYALIMIGNKKLSKEFLLKSFNIIFNDLSNEAAAVVLRDIRADQTIKFLMK